MNNEMTALHIDDSLIDESGVIQLVGMKLGEEEYAIDVLKIQEIIRTLEITIVPRSDSYILGVMNLRGRVIPVVDLRVRFNLEKMDFDQDTRIIVVRFEKEQIGFVVDEVTQVIRISQSMVEPTPPLVGAIGQEYILGICKFDERLIILLDIDRIISKSNNMAESDLRKKLLGTDKKKAVAVKKAASAAPKAEKAPSPKPETAPKAEKAYSMADEADAMSKPLIKAVEADSDLDSILEDAVNQGSSVTKSNAENEIQQSDLDSLIAAELAKREAETDELNKKRKESTHETPSSGEEALSIDDLIAMELAKREAETDELNKKRADEGDKKKK